jgi:hypothetical protein
MPTNCERERNWDGGESARIIDLVKLSSSQTSDLDLAHRNLILETRPIVGQKATKQKG